MQISAEQGSTKVSRRAGDVERAFKFADLSGYSFKQRLIIRLADFAFYSLINLIGRTIKFEVTGWEIHEQIMRRGQLPIYVFWHERIFLTTYWWRDRRLIVLTSKSFDGEYIARFIQRFGYGTVRGSSTRGGVGAVVELVRLMRQGCGVGFTIDGPKGPPRVAKMGAVLLAKKTGHPILPVTMALERHWTAPTWDNFQVPKPFSRACVMVAAPIYVAADADEAELSARNEQLQTALDELTKRGELWREGLLNKP